MKLPCTIETVLLIQPGTVFLATGFSGRMMYFMSNILRQFFYMMYFAVYPQIWLYFTKIKKLFQLRIEVYADNSSKFVLEPLLKKIRISHDIFKLSIRQHRVFIIA